MSDHEYADHRGDDPSKSHDSLPPSRRPRSEHHPAHEGREIRGDRMDRQPEYGSPIDREELEREAMRGELEGDAELEGDGSGQALPAFDPELERGSSEGEGR